MVYLAVDAARKATTLSKEDNLIFYLAQIYAHFGDADLAFESIQKLIDKTNRRQTTVRGISTTRSNLGPDSQRSALGESDRLTRGEGGKVVGRGLAVFFVEHKRSR